MSFKLYRAASQPNQMDQQQPEQQSGGFKLYKPSNQQVQEQPEQVEEEFSPENGIMKAIRNVVGAGSQAASLLAAPFSAREKLQQQGIESLKKSMSNEQVPQGLKTAGNRILNERENRSQGLGIEGLKTGIESALPKDYLKPRNENEEVFQDYASMVPLHFLTGGTASAIPSLFFRTAVGRKAGEAVKSMGGGEIGNIAAQIGVPALLEGLNVKRIKDTFLPYKKDIYTSLPKVAGNAQSKAVNLESALEKASQSAKGRKGTNLIYENLNDIKKEIVNGSIPVEKLQPIKTKLNDLIYKDRRDVLKPVLSEVNSLIDQHPKYAKAVKDADALHTIFNKLEDTDKFFKELTNVKGYKNKSGLISKAGKLFFEAPTVKSTILLGKIAKRFPKESADYATKAFKAASKKQIPQFFNYMGNLEKLIDKVEKEEE